MCVAFRKMESRREKKATRYAFETLEYLANCAREATREPGVAGAPGKVPARDLLRIWDSGASQGMTDMSLVSSDARVKGESITTHTGNGPMSSTSYERVVVAPGLEQTHVALPSTANTVSLGSLNEECQVGFQWLQPLSRKTGCTFGYQAISPASLDAPILAQISSSSTSSKYVSTDSLKQGTIHYDGLFKFFPCGIAAKIP